ncbi:MAG: hypothetical protein ACLRRA_03245 [Acutalibacteraceae bacterium]
MMEEKQRLHPDAKTGLTSQQVASQKEKGLKNEATEKISKSTGQIIKDNVCTLFNLFNLIIAIALACVGALQQFIVYRYHHCQYLNCDYSGIASKKIGG